MRNSTANRLEGVFSVDATIAHFQALVSQEKHLNTRYIDLTDTEADLLAKLKLLQQELSGLEAGYIDSAELSPQLLQGSSLGATQNLIRFKIDEKTEGAGTEHENIARNELLQGYFLLFFMEIREKVTSVLELLHTWLSEDYLLPNWSRIARSESLYGLSWSEEAIGLNSVLHRLYSEISSLKLNITAQDLRSLAAAPASTLETFAHMLEIAGLRYAEKLKKVVTDLSTIFTKLWGNDRKISAELDDLALSESQLNAYKRIQPAALHFPINAKISDMINALLEYRLTHAPVETSSATRQADFHTFVTQFDLQTRERRSRDTRAGSFLVSQQLSSSDISQYGRLLKQSGENSKSNPHFPIGYEQELLNQVSKTETLIKSIEDRSNFHTERVTARSEAKLQEPRI
jgi:hypothetical protein